jgi:endonuclease YncB( thermonuclease family)
MRKEDEVDNFIRAFELIRVINGDTVEGYVDLGFRRYDTMRLRLKGIIAPSMRSKDQGEKEQAKAAKMWLQQRLMKHSLYVQIFKTNKFDKYLAVLFADGGNINDEMLKAGHVQTFKKETTKPAPTPEETK